ncbi:MAG: hypothetical protein CVV52_03260 [Spirochaetae bacterium HGW-Spirochaetae-8]|jgi:DNA-binding LacI/PurR family transcriptional regulator|nr:MAG: hypothetical protein CVV52_03260 [Spirochaetae bacterium HGW-Spirochaetae-8]
MTKKHSSTIRDVALKAGVSETTVSLSFKPLSRVSDETRARILAIANELNYVPNSVAQSLRVGRTKTLGFIVNDITESFYSVMSRTATDTAYNYGYQLIYAENGWSPTKAIESTKSMLAQRVEGLILCLCEKEVTSIQLIESLRIPHIVVDTSPDFYKGPYVINNEFAIGELAGAHLIEQGCRNIGFFNASKDMASFSSFSQQLAGLKRAVGAAGISMQSKDNIFAGISIEDGAQAFKRLLERDIHYDGILCINDEVAYGVMQEAERRGLKVGRDLAVIGIDNLKTSSLDRVALTSIHMNYELMTTLAVSTLINGIESGHEITSRIVLEPELIIRSSSQLSR